MAPAASEMTADDAYVRAPTAKGSDRKCLARPMQGKQSGMQRECIALIDPDRLDRFDNQCKALRSRSMMSSAWSI
jgi:hypothetical protein